MPRSKVDIKQFRGIKSDENPKQTPPDYFWKCVNYNFPDTGLLGMEKILMPQQIHQFDNANIDGMFEYKYLASDNTLHTEYIVVNNGDIENWDLASTHSNLKTGLTAGKVSFALFNDKLYIANGLDYVHVYDGYTGKVTQMGAPIAVASDSVGNLNGAYYYALTYTTPGGEEVLGSISNTVTVANKQMDLKLPLGYSGTTARNIYRTAAGGSSLYLVYTVSDNTTLTYTDNTSDATLITHAAIPAVNNELPKPYFLLVAGEKLYGLKTTKYPTQVFVSETDIDVWDSASFIDTSNFGGDNTPVAGGGVDFNKVIVGSGKHIYMIDPVDNSVIVTRANVGIKDGYSCKTVPSFGDFTGGLMFLSTENDVRVMSGVQGIIPATIDKVSTENWAQNIRGDLESALESYTNIYAEYYKYKFHLVIDSVKFVWDIRLQGWTKHHIKTNTTNAYTSTPKVLAVMNGNLYNGQSNGYVEKEYTLVTYRSEEVDGYIESPYISVSSDYKYFEKMLFWFIPAAHNHTTITVYTDDNKQLPLTATFSVLAHTDFEVKGGAFNDDYFSNNWYTTDLTGLDYRAVNINRPCRWLRWIMKNTTGNLSFQGITYIGSDLRNREGGD